MAYYTDMTYDRIMQRCLERVVTGVDKREGSIIYDALAPAAAELAILYSTFSGEMDRAFPDTARDIDLTNKAKERSVFRLPATCAVRKGVFTGPNGYMDIPIGSRFSGGTVNYVASERISTGLYRMTCEEAGAAGNAYFGNLIPIDYIPNLSSATLSDILIPGEDEEDDDTLRARYLKSLKSESFGGNVAQYKEQVEKIPGVGAVKVFRVWNGGIRPADLKPPEETNEWIAALTGVPDGIKAWLNAVYAAGANNLLTVGGKVKLTILDSEGAAPSDALVDEVQTAIDPEQNHGEGLGLAPIGHVVTVEGAGERAVDIAFALTLDTGYTYESITGAVRSAIESYFAELITGWADASALVVRVSQLESRILDVTGVLDITGTSINESTENLILTGTEIPVLGTVTNNT